MKQMLFRLGSLLALLAGLHAAEFGDARAKAEAAYAEGSFTRAHALYQNLPTNLPPAEARWLTFRLHDSGWRAQGERLRSVEAEAAVQALDAAFPQGAMGADRDPVWADAQESLGDLADRRGDPRDWVQTRYRLALDGWAGQTNLDLARRRYLAVVDKWVAGSTGRPRGWPWSEDIDPDVLNRAVEIARTPADVARMRFYRARHGRHLAPPDPRALHLVEEDFQAALQDGKGPPWRDRALFEYAGWLARSGRLVLPADGSWARVPDAPRALERYRQLLSEYREGESEFWPVAKAEAEALTREHLGVVVPGAFLPGSEVQFHVDWRNLRRLEWTLRPVQLPGAVQFTGRHHSAGEWLSALETANPPLQQGVVDIRDGGLHEPGRTNLILPSKLPLGAYLLELKGGDARARELVLVSDVVLTLKAGGPTTLAWLTDVMTGQPVPEAQVRFWRLLPGAGPGTPATWDSADRTTGSDGVATLEKTGGASQIFVSASAPGSGGSRQALTTTWSSTAGASTEPWRLYVFTDRPAYRPEESVRWKLIARRGEDGGYRAPVDLPLYYEVRDPRSGVLTNGVARLNEFGSAWGAFILGTRPVLGPYTITFWEDATHQRSAGSAMLFRSEEYKLPEFEVKVRWPEEDRPDGGRRPRTYTLGERVEIAVQADYYAGGAVADAEVELLVRQAPWHMAWPMPREFPWYHGGGNASAPFDGGRIHGGDPVVRREQLRTDAAGRAVFVLETDPAGPDMEYRVEARVRDTSRREVTGSGDVRVTRQRYFASARPLNRVIAPGAPARIEFRTQDANRQTVSVPGTVTITRERWTETWRDPSGKDWSGGELDALRSRSSIWPPPVPPGEKPWRLRHRGYDREELASQRLTTGTNGVVELAFTPDRDGFYRFAWRSPGNATAPASTDPRPRPFEPEITTETHLWACSRSAVDLGYRSGGIEILLDADTAREGSRLPVLLVTSAPDRWVLWTTEAGNTLSHEVVHLTGTSRLLELPLSERHVPNVHLGAILVHNRQLFADEKEVVVPADRHFLQVTVTPEPEVSGPRGTGSVRVTTRDREGRPVSAEVALGMFDDSVYAIQEELAGDPRPFFFGQKRPRNTHHDTGLQQRAYLRLLRRPGAPGGGLTDERDPFPAAETEGEEETVASESIQSRRDLPMASFALDEGRARMQRKGGMPSGRALGGRAVDAVVAMLDSASPSGAPQAGAAPTVVVRSDFRSTAFWQPDLRTGVDGLAQVSMTYPDALTRWRITARAVGPDTTVGWATNHAQTRLPLRVRLQAPRFFVVGDRTVVSSVLMNQTDAPLEVRSTLDVSGGTITGGYRQGDFVKEKRPPTVVVPARGTFTDNWVVQVASPGRVTLKAGAVTVASGPSPLSDGVEQSYVAHPRGIQQSQVVNGEATGADTEALLDLPAGRVDGSTRLAVQVTPSLAMTMLAALPYLADYPYGSTEQTLSRFLPAVVVRRTLRDLGLDAEAAMAHALGGARSSATGPVSPRLGSRQDLTRLDAMVQAGRDRLMDFQKADGSWGWWKEGASDAWMTAYVVWGLNLAVEAGVEVEAAPLGRAVEWLEKHLVDANQDPGRQAWMLHALATHHRRTQARVVRTFVSDAFQGLWTRRASLTSYERALLALSAPAFGAPGQAATLVRNLEDGVVRGDAANSGLVPGTVRPSQPLAHWGQEQGWWRWTDGAVESTATALRALLVLDPKNPLVDPALRWLLQNRRGASWSNTRDTTLALLALNEHMRLSGEARGDVAFIVECNGREIGRRDLRGKAPWELASTLEVPAGLVRERNRIRIRRTAGTGRLHYAVRGDYFTAGESIAPAGNGLFVRREYFRLVGRPTLLKGLVYERVPLRDGDRVTSGDRVEAVLTVETKNDYEYLSFEDLKPAGMEATVQASGGWLVARPRRDVGGAAGVGSRVAPELPGPDRLLYPEWRDRQVALFADRLPAGVWEVRLEFRAEVPGDFQALPVVAEALYVPELRGNSGNLHLQVRD